MKFYAKNAFQLFTKDEEQLFIVGRKDIIVNKKQGENIVNEDKPKIYNTGITVIGEYTTVPDNVSIGKNCVIYGKTAAEDYPDNRLESGKSIVKETEEVAR